MRGTGDDLPREDTDHGQRAEGSHAAVLENLPEPLSVPCAPESVREIGESVPVQGPGYDDLGGAPDEACGQGLEEGRYDAPEEKSGQKGQSCGEEADGQPGCGKPRDVAGHIRTAVHARRHKTGKEGQRIKKAGQRRGLHGFF